MPKGARAPFRCPSCDGTGSKMHEADVRARELIAGATDFRVFMHRFRARIMEDGFTTLASAAARADQIEIDNPGRKALIYAVVGGNSHPVPDDLRAAASAQTNEGN